ncbi:MAG: CDP-alcohol phosphatidyltransferase family protein [Myxococcales bacterium]|nr:CDP-alcohol phosphatidyltransferase family protein [Myxococcales bacterium]
MNVRKTFFILPNLFTLTNILCGFFAITLCAGGRDEDLYQAALAICFGFFFDLFDGRVARLTRTQSELGEQLDSLADVVTFGAAPAMLVYRWGLTQFGLWGVFIAFLFLGAGAMRLARFNVLAAREREAKKQAEEQKAAEAELEGPPERAVVEGEHEAEEPGSGGKRRQPAYFLGLSIPAAAATIVSLVVVHHHVGGQYVAYSQSAIAVLVVVLSYLMVSRVRFRSFKDLRVSRRSLAVTFLLLIASILIITRLRASFVFLFLISAYIALGLTEEVYRFAAERRRARRAAKLAAGTPLDQDDEEPEDDEDEVLRELGADP